MIIRSLNSLNQEAAKLTKKLNPNSIICLYGELGSGKTTLTQSIAKALKVKEKVKSPTYTIFKEYQTGTTPITSISHFDLYRLNEPDENIENLLQQSISKEGNLTIIEWPEKAIHILPKNRIEIEIIYIDEFSREFNITSKNE